MTEPTTTAMPESATAGIRSRLYALLAEVLSFPRGSILERLRSGALQTELQVTAAQLPVPLALPAPAADAPADPGDAAATDYTRLFHACRTRPAVSMLEHRHRAHDSPPLPLWEDLLCFYRNFGLDFRQASARESPDHLLVELEFMHYLSYLEAGATATRADLLRGQLDFLRRHLVCWVGDFAAALARHAPQGIHAAAAALLADFVAADILNLQRELACA